MSEQRFPRQFPRQLRLLKPDEFRQVFQANQRASSHGLTVLGRANGLSHPRIGLAIAKKGCPLAVQRNRIKRQSREALRGLQRQLGGVDFVVLSRPGLWQRDNRAIRRTLEKHLLELASRCAKS